MISMTSQQDEREQVLRDALAWGRVYGPDMSMKTWEEMREVMVKQFIERLFPTK